MTVLVDEMQCKQETSAPSGLPNKASSLSSRSAGSATSVGTSRSGGSRLLFGEIDTSSERSSGIGACVNSFVLCESAKFLRIWLDERCRKVLLAYLSKSDLANVRLVCHDFSVQAAPNLFSSVMINFNSSVFTKSTRIAELDRIGSHVENLSFHLPHSMRTLLPPLVDPWTGEELNFNYSPQIKERSPCRPIYGDSYTTDLLARQYPPLFHAATNVRAFIRAFAALPNVRHLRVSCPDYDTTQRYRRSAVDYALISLRLAIEHNHFGSLSALTVAPIHPGGLMCLSPLFGFGASPKSARRWTQIRDLTMHLHLWPSENSDREPDHFLLLQTYLRIFQSNLRSFHFHWIGRAGPLPIKDPDGGRHPALAPSSPSSTSRLTPARGVRSLRFSRLESVTMDNVVASAAEISLFWTSHETIKALEWNNTQITSGTWDDVSRAVSQRHSPCSRMESAEIPIMLAPSMMGGFPQAMERVERVARPVRHGRWPIPRPGRSFTTQRTKDGWLGCGERLKKVLRGWI